VLPAVAQALAGNLRCRRRLVELAGIEPATS
jgi:hypothetical protein